ncbi:MAG: hypothetical protein HZA83_01120, partial [Thaumarchaeota archaeon]|nr:hypothetical protein [Nitrososphaerota archaeon]
MLVLSKKDARTTSQLAAARRAEYFASRSFEHVIRDGLAAIDRTRAKLPKDGTAQRVDERTTVLRREFRALERFTVPRAIVERLNECERICDQIASLHPLSETALYPARAVNTQLEKIQSEATSMLTRLLGSRECSEQLFRQLADFIERVKEARLNNISLNDADRLRVEFACLRSTIQNYAIFTDVIESVIRFLSEAGFNLDNADIEKLNGTIPDRNYGILSEVFELARQSAAPDSRKTSLQMENGKIFLVQIIGNEIRYLTADVEASRTVDEYNIVSLTNTRGTHPDDIMIIPVAQDSMAETPSKFYIIVKMDTYDLKLRSLSEG